MSDIIFNFEALFMHKSKMAAIAILSSILFILVWQMCNITFQIIFLMRKSL